MICELSVVFPMPVIKVIEFDGVGTWEGNE